MSARDFSPKDLTKEKRLWDIFVASSRIRSNWFNVVSTALVFLALSTNAWFTPQPIAETLQVVRSFSILALSTTLSTLGFLLAGFTIFATITQPTLSLAMAELKHPESGLSWLKHNYFVFLRVFIYYLVFAVFCLIIQMFGHKGGLIPLVVSYSPYSEHVKFAVVKIGYVIIFTGAYFLIMQLKSFIFNIYHSVMTALRWKAEGYG